MMAPGVDKVSSSSSSTSSSCTSQSSPLSEQEKATRNKRKFHGDTSSTSDPDKVVLPSMLNDGLNYEFSPETGEITRSHEELPSGLCDHGDVCRDRVEALKIELGLGPCDDDSVEDSSEVGGPKEEQGIEYLHDADWGDLSEGQLEDLVLSNLDTIFKGAIKKIVACGYTEEVATKAVLTSGLCYGSKDMASNIVDNALASLRDGQDVDCSKDRCFEDLQQLVKYVLDELVRALREVRPSFSTGDAMWCLLICDMNISHAGAMDGDLLNSLTIDGLSNEGSSSGLQHQSEAEPKSAEVDMVPEAPNITKPNKSLSPRGLNSEKDGSTPSSSNTTEKSFGPLVKTQTLGMEGKILSSRRVHSTSSKILRQRSLHLEKSYRTGSSKGGFRAAKFSGLFLDKRYKSISDSAALNMKSASVKMNKAMAMGVQLASSMVSSSSPQVNPDMQRITKIDHPPAPLVRPIPQNPVADTELSLSLPSKSNASLVTVSDNAKAESSQSLAGLPYDRFLAQFVPQDEKDETIMKAVSRIKELKNQLQEWDEWAKQKVAQATRRLTKDKAELKALRQERDEVERLRKEKQCFEDNTMKKLSEMENALGKASEQVGLANATVRRLKLEKMALGKEMEAANLRAAQSATSCREASNREKEMSTKLQSWEKEKGMFQEELAAERRQMSRLQQEVEQAKDLQNQLEGRWKQEEKAKEELQTQANSIRKEREELEASVKRKEEAVKLKAETNLQKCKEDIQKLEAQISQLRLKTDSSKIAALKRGIAPLPPAQTSPNLEQSQDPFMGPGAHLPSTGVKRDRECVMCLSEEISVVFLPCAHQVVCKGCNEMHEKQGMTDCPSCRSPILHRVCVRYAP